MANMSWGALQRLCSDEPPIRVWREERGLTLAELAEQTCIDPDRLARLDGETNAPNLVELERLATVLRVPREYLILPQDDSSEVPTGPELAFADE
jgi:transcriptional regulator with XRE-family HTH domain